MYLYSLKCGKNCITASRAPAVEMSEGGREGRRGREGDRAVDIPVNEVGPYVSSNQSQ